MNNNLHFFLNSKGGVGKSTYCRLFASYFYEKKIPFLAFDVDTDNITFSRTKEFNVHTLSNITDFNNLFEIISNSDVNNNTNIIIDIGSNSVSAIKSFLTDDMFNISQTNLENIIKKDSIYFHQIFKSGSFLNDCIRNFESLLSVSEFSDKVKIVIWLNNDTNDVIFNNKKFIESDLYTKNKDKIDGVISIPNFRPRNNYGNPLYDVLENESIYAPISDIIKKDDFPMIASYKIPLNNIWNYIKNEIEKCSFIKTIIENSSKEGLTHENK